MATDKDFIEFVVNQIDLPYPIRYVKMFGEYALYCNHKVVALICDNRMLVKITEEGKAFIGDYIEGIPYPGGKPCFHIEEKLEDSEWLSELLEITYNALPEPKPKKKKKSIL
jgi:TfoX/Sxy family transcriptional regulator of competence genes